MKYRPHCGEYSCNGAESLRLIRLAKKGTREAGSFFGVAAYRLAVKVGVGPRFSARIVLAKLTAGFDGTSGK